MIFDFSFDNLYEYKIIYNYFKTNLFNYQSLKSLYIYVD